jgi:hypothetical protein
MELGAVQYSKLTDAEREALRKAGKCFFCRTGKHRAVDCPLKVSRPSKKPEN